MQSGKTVDITIVGGGMITNDLILPAVYHLQRTGIVGSINVCALDAPPLKALRASRELKEAFPGQTFNAFPAVSTPAQKKFPDLYKKVLAGMKPYSGVIVAMPDQLHYPVIKEALKNNLHVLTVKPLVLKYRQAVEIEKEALRKGLFVGVEYHKRFDRRALVAKKDYALGRFGEFRTGEAKMIEPWFYRHSNFQNWFTRENTDPFAYVGCHYVDLVYFITGLKPVNVSVQGVPGTFPNGNTGYMWAQGRVRFENGALLTVTNGLGYPDDGAGSNDQNLVMYCDNGKKAAIIKHNDQFRGVSHGYVKGTGPGGSVFNYVNPDFYRLVPWEGNGYKPTGYGYDSVAASVSTMHAIENAIPDGTAAKKALARRRDHIKRTDRQGLIATPANSYINELVMEAGRKSILADGKNVSIIYGARPRIR